MQGSDDNATDNGTDVGDNESTKDKGNKGNFYTVTPKLTFNFRGIGGGGSPNRGNSPKGGSGGKNGPEAEAVPELIEAQQFFEHMIALQKNQETLAKQKGTSRRASANINEQVDPASAAPQPTAVGPNNVELVQNNLNKQQTLQRGKAINVNLHESTFSI